MEPTIQNRNRERRWHPGQIHVRFTNGAHLADSLAFLSQTGQTAAFWEKIGYLVTLFRNDAAGWSGGLFSGTPESMNDDHPPRNVNIWLSPDAISRPSFTWRAETTEDKAGAKPQVILHGGLIYRDADGWTIHT